MGLFALIICGLFLALVVTIGLTVLFVGADDDNLP